MAVGGAPMVGPRPEDGEAEGQMDPAFVVTVVLLLAFLSGLLAGKL